jgi:signal recognition particle GTPase
LGQTETDVPIVRQEMGSDPASALMLKSAVTQNADVVIIDSRSFA